MSTFPDQTTTGTDVPKVPLHVGILFGIAAAVTLINAAVCVATTMLDWSPAPLNLGLASMVVLWLAALLELFEFRRSTPPAVPAFPDAARALESAFNDLDRKLRDY
ncbi:hypothetical protein GCM10027258_63180 [Amycolatopsis stemonae]